MKVIDLSQTLHSKMTVYPGDPDLEIDIIHNYQNEGWQLRQLKMGTHTGTHVDAFSHMHLKKASIDQIPLERFFGRAQLVRKADDWPEGIGLLFKEKMTIKDLDPILESKTKFVGGQISEKLERALLKAEVVTYTDLVNLEQLPIGQDFTFYGLPLKIKDGDGSPVRAIAIINQE